VSNFCTLFGKSSCGRQAKCVQRDYVACVDDPLDAGGKMRNLTGGSIAIICPALSTRHDDRWPI
jgi:hypothetical protein